MFSFLPLRTYLEANNLSVKWLMREVGFSTNVAVALNNDQPVKIEIIAEICRFLKLSIEEVVIVTQVEAP